MKTEERNAHELEKKVMRSSHQVHLRVVCDLSYLQKRKDKRNWGKNNFLSALESCGKFFWQLEWHQNLWAKKVLFFYGVENGEY